MVFLPTRTPILILVVLAGIALLARILGVDAQIVTVAAAALVCLLLGVAFWDGWVSARAWRASDIRLKRRLPSALALDARREVRLALENPGPHPWQLRCYDHPDPTLKFTGLPVNMSLIPGQAADTHYQVTPTQRGEVTFKPARVRVRSRWGWLEMQTVLGDTQTLHVFPNFSQVARYAWLAGNRRLAEIGIKSVQQRGEGTDFKQLSDYHVGHPIRHMDWKATLKHGRPIVREFQDERDQRVVFLLDCGRRMRAHERRADDGEATQISHFDEALNALMLLSYVALKLGDAVGAMTFGASPEAQRLFAPRKGIASFNALMTALYAVQPEATHSDYLIAAGDLMRRHTKRSLVVILTNFRDEDAAELTPALALLRTRHLVMLTSLREKVVREIQNQPLNTTGATLEVASAHLYAQTRDDAFRRLASRDTLLMDVEPDRLAVELVNRYHAVKRAGML